jgi:hypothetical protein
MSPTDLGRPVAPEQVGHDLPVLHDEGVEELAEEQAAGLGVAALPRVEHAREVERGQAGRQVVGKFVADGGQAQARPGSDSRPSAWRCRT